MPTVMQYELTDEIMNPEKGIAVFTDGSAWTGDRIGGWAFLALDAFGNVMQESDGERDTTISRMELQGAIAALMSIGLACGSCDILVYSDSQYVVFGATDRSRKRNHNNDLWDLLDELVDSHNYVEFIHVKGHADSEYNNRVDGMAGDARRRAQGNDHSR